MNALQRIAQVILGSDKLGVEIETLSESLSEVESFVENLPQSPLELYLLFDRAEKISKEIKKVLKEEAGEEFQLLNGDESKSEVFGNTITLSTINTYDFKETTQIKKYTKEIDKLNEVVEPTLLKIKGFEESIKSLKDAQKNDGTAKIIETNYRLSISKS